MSGPMSQVHSRREFRDARSRSASTYIAPVFPPYLACFLENRTLNIVLMTAMPAKKITSAELSPLETFPARKRMYPAARLNSAQTTFTVGDDNPFPGGLANGVGKRSPEMPCTK